MWLTEPQAESRECLLRYERDWDRSKHSSIAPLLPSPLEEKTGKEDAYFEITFVLKLDLGRSFRRGRLFHLLALRQERLFERVKKIIPALKIRAAVLFGLSQPARIYHVKYD